MKKVGVPVQLILRCHKRGGARRGAGQKKVRVNEPSHARRKAINFRKPIHITIRLVQNKPSLRERRMQLAFLRAIKNAKAHGLAVQQYALVGNHAHFVCEAEDNKKSSPRNDESDKDVELGGTIDIRNWRRAVCRQVRCAYIRKRRRKFETRSDMFSLTTLNTRK